MSAGVPDTAPLTVRQVYRLSVINQERQWMHTGSLLSIINNSLSKTKTTPDDHNAITLAKKKKLNRRRGMSIRQAKELYENKFGGK